MREEVLTAIKTRRSCRRYGKEQVKDEDLKAVLEAGTYAPTAKGMQDPYIVAVQNEADLKQLATMNAAVMGTSANPYYDAPTYILVFATDGGRNALQDGSCVLENMMLAAHAVGLATCWINREREMFETPEGKALMAKWGLPEGLMGVGALSIGYAEGPMKAPKERKEGYYRIV
jgi:nitroreductase